MVGMLTWLIVDSPKGPSSGRRETASKPVSSPFETPAPPAGQPWRSASKSEPLFEEAMGYYRAHDYFRASFTLRQATARQPDNPDDPVLPRYLVPAHPRHRAGINELKVAEGLEGSCYDDRIHFYLAKAFLKQNDTTERRALPEPRLWKMVELWPNLPASSKSKWPRTSATNFRSRLVESSSFRAICPRREPFEGSYTCRPATC